MKADIAASAETRYELDNKYGDVFSGFGCFTGTFSLQVKEGIISGTA